MANPKNKKKNRTQVIPIHETTPFNQGPNLEKNTFTDQISGAAPIITPHKAYELHIEAAHAPNQIKRNSAAQSQAATPLQSAAHESAPAATPTANENSSARIVKKASPVSIKIWNTLEWLATSALIFIVFFFIMNFQAYSTIIMDKLNHLRGQVSENQFVPGDDHSAAPGSQQPLPLALQDKKQIPNLDMSISPPDERIIIPRINKNVPIVKTSDQNLIKRDWSALEKEIQGALRDGVVHYPGTAEPGANGNVVITGHSSYFAWDPGRFKDVFALLHQVVIGDKIMVFHNQKLYVYEVYDIKVVTPDKVDVLTQGKENKLTLITCTPVGTNLKRLVVIAKPVNNY